MKKLLSLLLSAMLMLTITGCTEIEYNTNEPEPTDYPVIVDEVEFSAAPATVASLSPALTEMIYELGYQDKLVARSTYCDYPQAVSSLVDIGSAAKPKIAKIIAIKPELLITQSPIAKTDKDSLEAAGIKVVVLESPDSVAELHGCYERLAAIFGGELTSKAAADNCMNPLATALSQTSPDGSFAYLMTYDYGTATGDTLAGEILSYFGENIASENTKYSFPAEQLIEKNPDKILLSSDVSIDGFDAEIGELDAVRSGRCITIDSSCFERPTSRRLTQFVSGFGAKLAALPDMQEFEEPAETEETEENE